MQRADAGAVKGSLHFHGPVFAFQRLRTQLALFFLPCQQLLTCLKRGFDMGWHHLLQALH